MNSVMYRMYFWIVGQDVQQLSLYFSKIKTIIYEQIKPSIIRKMGTLVYKKVEVYSIDVNNLLLLV